MQEIKYEIVIPCDLHGRTANYIASEINTIKSRVLAIKDGRSVRMNSLLGVLSLGSVCGESITIVCINEDKESAEKDFMRVKKILTEARKR